MRGARNAMPVPVPGNCNFGSFQTRCEPFQRPSSRCGGASVLLYAICPLSLGKYVVLGRDSFGQHEWSDFGGGAEGEKDYQCAARELCEETHGIFPTFTVDCLRALRKIVFEFPHATNPQFTMHYSTFIGQVPFPAHAEDLSTRFDLALAAMPANVRHQDHIIEKAELRLFALQEVNSLQLRAFFRTRLQFALPLLADHWGGRWMTTVLLRNPNTQSHRQNWRSPHALHSDITRVAREAQRKGETTDADVVAGADTYTGIGTGTVTGTGTGMGTGADTYTERARGDRGRYGTCQSQGPDCRDRGGDCTAAVCHTTGEACRPRHRRRAPRHRRHPSPIDWRVKAECRASMYRGKDGLV